MKKDYRKHEQKLTTKQLRNDSKTIPRHSRDDDMMKRLYETHKKPEKNYSIQFKGLWVNSTLNRSKDNLVSEKLQKIVGEKMTGFCNELLKTGVSGEFEKST